MLKVHFTFLAGLTNFYVIGNSSPIYLLYQRHACLGNKILNLLCLANIHALISCLLQRCNGCNNNTCSCSKHLLKIHSFSVHFLTAVQLFVSQELGGKNPYIKVKILLRCSDIYFKKNVDRVVNLKSEFIRNLEFFNTLLFPKCSLEFNLPVINAKFMSTRYVVETCLIAKDFFTENNLPIRKKSIAYGLSCSRFAIHILATILIQFRSSLHHYTNIGISQFFSAVLFDQSVSFTLHLCEFTSAIRQANFSNN
ncbi:hypothetical protein Bhyg_05895 [Pseudolycoriella hygida]|uniref:Uncharacterized protein n=1 Tax=Pseudolycoriella hygida TaxID=35572 RepID=A0A9Q0S0F7_9DIPT|nr:hypothetical protein Bhyg_05895 [Pseudolycoriella hygida]